MAYDQLHIITSDEAYTCFCSAGRILFWTGRANLLRAPSRWYVRLLLLVARCCVRVLITVVVYALVLALSITGRAAVTSVMHSNGAVRTLL